MAAFYELDAEGRGHRVLVDEADPSVQLMEAEDGGDDGATIDCGAISGIPRDALLVLLRFLLPATRHPSRWRQAQIRLAVVAHLTNLDGVGDMSLEKLSNELGCTRALLSMRTLQILDGFGFDKSRSGKARASRQVYQQAAIESHKRRGNKVSSQPPSAIGDR